MASSAKMPSFTSLLEDLRLNHQRQEEQIAALKEENEALRGMLGSGPDLMSGPSGPALLQGFSGASLLSKSHEDRKREEVAARLRGESDLLRMRSDSDPAPKRLVNFSLLQCLPVSATAAALLEPAATMAAKACCGSEIVPKKDPQPSTAISIPRMVTSSTISPDFLELGGKRADPDGDPRDRFCGMWVDPEKEFFGGTHVHIWGTGWRPTDPTDETDRNCTFSISSTSDTAWGLLQERADGSSRRFVVEPHDEPGDDEDHLLVHDTDSGQEWGLDRVFGTARSITFTRQVPAMWPEWDVSPTANLMMTRIDSGDEEGQLPIMLALLQAQRHHVVRRDSETGQALLLQPSSWWDAVVMKPSSLRRIVWDFLSCCMVCFDVFTVPLMVFDGQLFEEISLQAALEQESSGYTYWMGWVTTIFWTFDVPMSLLTGFHSNGIIELRPRPILKQYMRTWAFFDFGILLPDWFFLLLPTAQIVGILRVTKGVRFMRILRAIRLLRFVRLQRFLHDVVEMINSETLRAFFTIVLALGFIVTLNHYLACGWYFLGRLGSNRDAPNWLEQSLSDERTESNPAFYGYFTAVHWSLTQFTPASMEVYPRNVHERMYSICVLLFAMVSFSSFLASITAAITNLRHFATETSKQKHMLRRYFMENRVPSELGNRIWSFLKKNHFKPKRTHKQDVVALQSLTSTLQKELCTALYLPYVTRMPFLASLLSVHGGLVTSICELVTERSLSREEEIFHKNTNATSMLILITGELSYKHSDRRMCATLTDAGDWVCEQVLWMQWRHCGQLVSLNFSEMLVLEASTLRATIKKTTNNLALTFVTCYAKRFHNHFKAMQQEGNDLWRTDVFRDEEILEGLAKRSRNETTDLLQRPSPRHGSSRHQKVSIRSDSSSRLSGRSKRGVAFDVNFD